MRAFPRDGSTWRRLGWFVLLWVAGVVATGVVAIVFKLLILGAVSH